MWVMRWVYGWLSGSLALLADAGHNLSDVAGLVLAWGAALAGGLRPTHRRTYGWMRASILAALANALLEEVKAMPFTYCDPNDANAGVADNAAGCAGQPELMGPEPGEQRFSANAATRFDNINDYNGFTIAAGALRDAANNLIQPVLPTVANCGLTVGVANQAMVNVNAGDAVRITVTVRCPDLANTPPVVVEAVRVRYAPNRFEF